MTKSEVLKQLRANGTAQNRKVYRRHGITGELFGVSYAALGKLKKKIKFDQSLAEQLWATGNFDARVLATMIADANEIGVGTRNAWTKEAGNRGLAAMLSNLAAEAPSAKGRMEQWPFRGAARPKVRVAGVRPGRILTRSSWIRKRHVPVS